VARSYFFQLTKKAMEKLQSSQLGCLDAAQTPSKRQQQELRSLRLGLQSGWSTGQQQKRKRQERQRQQSERR
jgi:hypothetical protein